MKKFIVTVSFFVVAVLLSGCAKNTDPDVVLITIEARSWESVTNAMTPLIVKHSDAQGLFPTPQEYAALKSQGYLTAAFLADRNANAAAGFSTVKPFEGGAVPLMQFRAFADRPAAESRRSPKVAEAAAAWVKQQPTSRPVAVWLQFRDFVFSPLSPLAQGSATNAPPVRTVEAATMDIQFAQFKEFMEKTRKGREAQYRILIVPNHAFDEALEKEMMRFLAAHPASDARAKATQQSHIALWRNLAYYFHDRSALADRPLEVLEAMCQDLLAADPKNAQFHAWLGILRSQRGAKEEALEAFTAATVLSPQTPFLLSNLGIAHWRMQDFPKSIDKLEDAFLSQQLPEYRDNLAFVLMNVGMALAVRKEFNDALACLSRVVLLQPNNPVAHLNLGHIYQAMGQIDMAKASYQKALDVAPKFIPARKALDRLKQ